MFSCSACLRRAIHNLPLENSTTSSPLLSNTHLRRTQKLTQNRSSRRHHATYDSLVKGHHRRALRLSLSQQTIKPNSRRKGAGSLTKGEIKDALARENNRNLLLSKDEGSTTGLTPNERRKQARLKQDIEQYYSDPLQLANVVTSRLRVPDFEAAIGLVRASEGIVAKNVVSWNHCIDWCMSQGDTDKAWKIYNELKKRGHMPDSHTYTIMLRGLSQNSRRAQSAQRAVGIYNSMFAPNSAVVPNTIHTNAALNVCARTRDMESLWAIAGRLPEKGPGSPDRWTFTTILNAIREDATARVADMLKDPKKRAQEKEEGMSLKDRQKVIFDEALRDGRKLWADVSHRWRRADLVVDERLVCAMGRLILGCGTRKDFGEVFDVVDSTMNIRLAERGHKKGVDIDIDEVEDENAPRDAFVEAKTETTLKEVEKSSMPFSTEQVYATPGNNTLDLVIEAATGMKEMKIGKAYWHFLTTPNGPYKIAPDGANVISYIRLLRISRSSKDILNLLSREWPDEVAEKLYRRGSFVIAMSSCLRDKDNPNVFETADKVLTLMQDKLEEKHLGMYSKIEATENDPNLSFKERQAAAKARMAKMDDVTFGEDEALSEMQRTKSGVESSNVDPKALRMYIDLAVLKTPGWSEGVDKKLNSEETFERDEKKNITLRALRRLGPEMINISRLAKLKLLEAEVASRPLAPAQKDDFSRNAQRKAHDRAGTRVAEKMEDLIGLLQTIVGAYDKVINLNERFEDEGRQQLDPKLIEKYRDLKRRISGFLSRSKDEVQKIVRGDLKYAKWRQLAEKESQDEDEDAGEDEDEDDEDDHFNAIPRSRRTETPKIGREIQRIYEDTDRSLGRTEQRSRRQKLERQNGIQQRMKKRLGVGQDVGVLDEDLSVRRGKEVLHRMRERAFGIRVGVGSQGEEKRVKAAEVQARSLDGPGSGSGSGAGAGAGVQWQPLRETVAV